MQCCDEQDMEQKENCNIWLHLILRFFSMRSAVSLEEQIDQEGQAKTCPPDKFPNTEIICE